MKTWIPAFAFWLLLSVCTDLHAQNTMVLEEEAVSPPAAINQVSWLEGHWRSEALGGIAEEYWSAPAGNAMMGMFRLLQNGKVSFYELFIISKDEGTLFLRLKHFDSRLNGWEEKDEAVVFRLVKIETDSVWFDGLTMKKTGDDQLMVYVRSDNRDGSISELEFPYKRVL